MQICYEFQFNTACSMYIDSVPSQHILVTIQEKKKCYEYIKSRDGMPKRMQTR